MNWLDLVLAVILLACLIGGFRRGFSRQVIGLVSGILALLLGIWLYGSVGSALSPYLHSRTMTNAGGFAIVFCGVLLAGAAVSFLVGRFLAATGLSAVDHLLGAGLGLLRGLVYSIAIIMGAMAFSRSDRPPEAIVDSRIAPYVVDASRLVAAMAPHELKEGFRKTYQQVKSAWSDALQKEMRHLPNGEKKKNERQI
jgi:membrane protein required for colicin V production